jgi:phage tail-like protein
MNALIPELRSAVPIIEQMPAIFQEDEFTVRFTGGLDSVWAPIFTALDCLSAYVDPYLTPVDFLGWLGGWVGVALEEDWPEERQRELIARAIQLVRYRGTVAGLAAEVALYTGGTVEVTDNGSTVWSQTPGAPSGGERTPRLAVRVTVGDTSRVNESTLDALVTAAKPAHVIHRVEVRKGST